MGKIIGIDLGTTNSCVAVLDGDKAKVIKIEINKKQIIDYDMVCLDDALYVVVAYGTAARAAKSAVTITPCSLCSTTTWLPILQHDTWAACKATS